MKARRQKKRSEDSFTSTEEERQPRKKQAIGEHQISQIIGKSRKSTGLKLVTFLIEE